jgi:hypothetical protein
MGWLMNMEHLVGWELAGEIQVLEENLPQFHFIHIKPFIKIQGWKGKAIPVTGHEGP